jgi:SAM-dependent methyltransferase
VTERCHSALVSAQLRAESKELERVASYYDAFADVAEERYTSNPVLARVRQGFRTAVERYPAEAMLDLGCGPGTDIAYFAQQYPRRRYRGIDLSQRMVEAARANLRALPGVRIERGRIADAPRVLPGERFEVVYSFFGPLNTEPDLRSAVQSLRSLLAPGGVAVLTFVSRVYAIDSALHLLRGRPRRAAARLANQWTGYTEQRPLAAHLYFPRQLEQIFGTSFYVERREGFSILYPAWYRAARFRAGGSLLRTLWLGDRALNRTPLWSVGEHLLYVFRAAGSRA